MTCESCSGTGRGELDELGYPTTCAECEGFAFSDDDHVITPEATAKLVKDAWGEQS